LILPDVNVLIAIHREDVDVHEPMVRWFAGHVEAGRPFLLADAAVAGFLRIVTHPGIYDPPSSLAEAVAFVDVLRSYPECRPVSAGNGHWRLLVELLTDANGRGNLVPDAHLAALAAEHGASVATRDRDFRRFRGVASFDPLAP
jgi:toxin-antitoxin system PIN domain toxin